jgi:hypothetical protein
MSPTQALENNIINKVPALYHPRQQETSKLVRLMMPEENGSKNKPVG